MIVEEAQRDARARDRDAAAAAHGGRSLFGKTLETVLAERPVPRHHRVPVPSDGATVTALALAGRCPSPRDVHRAATRDPVGRSMVVIGVAIARARTLAGGGGPLRSGIAPRRAVRARRRRAAVPRAEPAADVVAVAPPRTLQQRRLPARARRADLFAIVYTSIASAIYFSLGVVADHALGLTPVVFLVAGLFFVLAAMTYVEGASLHQDRARRDGLRPLRVQRAVELHRRLGDPARLPDPHRGLRVLGDELPGGVLGRAGRRARVELVVALAIIALRRGAQRPAASRRRARSASRCSSSPTSALQLLIVVARPGRCCSTSTRSSTSIDLGTTPTWKDVDLRAAASRRSAFTGLESAAGLAGEVAWAAAACGGWSASAAC